MTGFFSTVFVGLTLHAWQTARARLARAIAGPDTCLCVSCRGCQPPFPKWRLDG